MQYLSLNIDAGHLIERIGACVGAHEIGDGFFLVIGPAGEAAELLLREAAEGGWVVEFLTGPDEQAGQRQGEEVRLAGWREAGAGTVLIGHLHDGVQPETAGAPIERALKDINRVHVF